MLKKHLFDLIFAKKFFFKSENLFFFANFFYLLCSHPSSYTSIRVTSKKVQRGKISKLTILGTVLFLWEPTLIYPELILCSAGILREISSQFSYILMHSCLFTYLAQLLGIFLCLAFQFEYARTNGNTWIFNKKPKFVLILCSLLIISYGVLCYPIFMCKLNFSPQKHIDKNSSLYLYLSHETSCFSLGRLETPQISTLIVASLIFEFSFLLCFIFIHYKLIKLIYINNTLFSTRTYRLQQMLYKSILAQTLCFATIYMFPVGILLVMLIFKFQFSSSLVLILMSIINCYELMNYIVMLYYIGSFKKTLKKFLNMFFSFGNMQNVAIVDCNPGIVHVNDVTK